MAATINPSFSKHKDIIKSELQNYLINKVDKNQIDSEYLPEVADISIDINLVDDIINEIIDNHLMYNNYILFLYSKLGLDGKSNHTSIGIMGVVFVINIKNVIRSISYLYSRDFSDGVNLLFEGVNTQLTQTEKEIIYKSLGFGLSKNRDEFVNEFCNDRVDGELSSTFTAMVKVLDLNSDGTDEVAIEYGNYCTSGNAGSTIEIYIKDQAGEYKSFLGCSGILEILPTRTNEYNDILVGGPGFNYPVWTWNGKKYVHTKTINENELPENSFN
jgi:hypothetical protein